MLSVYSYVPVMNLLRNLEVCCTVFAMYMYMYMYIGSTMHIEFLKSYIYINVEKSSRL